MFFNPHIDNITIFNGIKTLLLSTNLYSINKAAATKCIIPNLTYQSSNKAYVIRDIHAAVIDKYNTLVSCLKS